jgi:hypothetical protein
MGKDTTATASSSQRKVASCQWAGDPRNYAVYTSGGCVWLIKKTEATGGEWSKELLLSSLTNPTAKNPSIAVTVDGGTLGVHVVWEETQGSNQVVYYRRSMNGGATWESAVSLAGLSLQYVSTGQDAKPVVSGSVWPPVVVWRSSYGGGSLIMRVDPVSVNTGYVQVSGTGGTTSNSPSLAYAYPGGERHLVYVKDNQIVYRRFSLGSPNGYPPSFWDTPTVVSGSYTSCANPSVASTGVGPYYSVVVAWDGVGASGRRIVSKKRDLYNAWSPTVELSHGTHAGVSPSVGLNDLTQSATIIFKCDAHIGQVGGALTPGAWACSAVQDLGQGCSPGVTDHNSGVPIAIFTQGTVAPYDIRVGSYADYMLTLAQENKSLQSSASYNNSARHLIVANGKFHEMLISGSEIFYRRQDRTGGTWEVTKQISSAGGTASQPSLCQLADGSLYTVWLQQTPQEVGTLTFDIFSSHSSDGTNWSAPGQVALGVVVSANQYHPFPTIGYCSGNKLVVVYCYQYGICYQTSTDGGVTWTAASDISPIQTSYRSYIWFPSLTTIDNTLWLSYDYRYAGVWQRSYNGTVWSAEANVSNGTGAYSGRHSSIAWTGASQPMVAFCAQTSTQTEYRTFVRFGNPPGWFQELPRVGVGISDMYPSVTSSYQGLYAFRPSVASYTSDNRVRFFGAVQDHWNERYLATNAAFAALSENRSTGNTETTVQWTSQQGAPFAVGLWTGNVAGKADGSGAPQYTHKRRLVIGDTASGGGALLSLEMSEPKMVLGSGDSSVIPFRQHRPLVDALASKPDSLVSYLGTDEFEVPAGARTLYWHLSVVSNRLEDTLQSERSLSAILDRSCTLALLDNQSRQLTSSRLSGLDSLTTTVMDVSSLAGKKVRVALKDIGALKKGLAILGVGDVYGKDGDEGSQGKLAKMEPDALPSHFELSEAYPNPFNPTTRINFALPTPGAVSLVVYDVLGREIATLASGTHDVGYYTATWDGTSKASGMYYVRLTVRGDLGRVNFTKVNKILLMK